MNNLNGNSSQKTLSKTFQISKLANIAELLLLFGLGMLAITLHVKLRIPLKLPGHHGVEFMALLMAGRYAANFRYAASISSFGVAVALLLPLWAGKDPFAGIVYMIPGFALDFLFNKFKRINSIFVISIMGGISYALIPITRLIITAFTQFQYQSLINSYLLPIATFTLFGFLGSLFGASLMKQISKRKKSKNIK